MYPSGNLANTARMGDTVTLPPSHQPVQSGSKRPRLRLVWAPHGTAVLGHLYSLPPGVTSIGRALPEDSDGIQFPGDQALSAVHARIEVDPKDYQVRVTDCVSKNGTYVGTQRCGRSTALMKDGDVLRVGSTFLVLRYEAAHTPDADIPSILGVSPAARDLRLRIVRLATESLPVLLLGETGTGKEVVAQALHRLAKRSGELVRTNCAAIPASLAESELFGHVEGSFTGAHDRQGLFQRANRGTLLLDEMGDLPLDLQAKLLRVLEERSLTPVGAAQPIRIDVRVIAATCRDLPAAVRAERFRRDLYMRLAQLVIELPPLRERREDTLMLLRHGSPEAMPRLTAELVHALLAYDWTGNVRELLAVANQLRVDGVTEKLLRDLRAGATAAMQPNQVATHSRGEVEMARLPPPTRPYRFDVPPREHFEKVLMRHLGTVKRVAEELGCSRKQVDRWLAHYGLRADDFRKPAAG